MDTYRIIVPMPAGLLQAVDDYRFRNRIASRAAAMRELLETALAKAVEKSAS